MSAILYTKKDGKGVTTFSHSAGQTFNNCRRRFQLEKIGGWKEKVKKAALAFGIAIESSIQHYHTNGLVKNTAAAKFDELWKIHEENKELDYGKDGGWDNLAKIGNTLMGMYEIQLPDLPIKEPIFQLNYLKNVFPGTVYDGIKFTAYVDMLTTLPNGEKMLVDIKTAGQSLSEIPNIASMDPQLRKYAWVSGVQNVAFLNLVKTKKPKIQFITGRVTDEAIHDTGEIVGRDIIEVAMADKKNFWPQNPGVKFPDARCTYCPFLGICLNNDVMRDEMVYQDTPNDDWLEEL